MYGIIGKIQAQPGARDRLIAAMAQGIRDMPGCVSYVIAEDAADADTVWVTEVWQSEAHHRGSLELPQVRACIAEAMPLIAGFEQVATTRPADASAFGQA